MAVGKERTDDLPSLFSYELCSYPSAIFESSCLPLQANKPALADAIWKVFKHEESESIGQVHYALDGVGHFCIIFHGLEQLLTTTYASCILIMLLNDMEDQP